MKNQVAALAGLAGLVALVSPAIASPLQLTDAQLDRITAGGTAAITVTNGGGATLVFINGVGIGYVSSSGSAGALVKGPVQVAVGNGTALAIGSDPTTTAGASGSGDTVIKGTFENGSGLVSFSASFSLALSKGQ